MKLPNALKIVLVQWAHAYHYDGSVDCIHELLHEVDPLGNLGVAVITWFGNYNPEDDTVNRFMQVYVGWMLAIDEHHIGITTGVITLDEVLIDQITKETWL